MTMIVTELLRLRGDECWSEWKDDWIKHVERIGEMSVSGWSQFDLRRAGFEGLQLDWGAFLFEMSKMELIQQYGGDTKLSPTFPAREKGEQWTKALQDLEDEDRYGAVFIECY